MSERISDIIEFRMKKLENLRRSGIDPYPSSTRRDTAIQQALDNFEKFSAQKKLLTLAGRIRSMRPQGKVVFMHLEDSSGKIQLFFKSDILGKNFGLLENFDIGDFIEATGILFKTKTEEKTVEVREFKMLAKSLRPLPGEFYGLENQELRLRKRYLDILVNADVRELFIKKSKFWSSARKFLGDSGFLEMELPVFESIPGGAEAQPFVTHHNALNRDFFLRISLELPLKKMIVAGFEKVFEIGRVFRNEGIDTEHLQDYTELEFYWAFSDFEMLMQFVQKMYQHIIKETFGTLKLPFTISEKRTEIIDWGGNWPKQDYFQLFRKHTGIDLEAATDQDLRKYAYKHAVRFENFSARGRLIDLIFKKKIIRPLPEVSMQPSFLVNQPLEIEPLAKRDPNNPKIVQRMQVLACGSELGKGFGELNDPIDQRRRFEEQMQLREKGDKEAQMIDEDYLEAMEYGMPPLSGFGFSERLFAVLADKSIRESVIFPPMKD